MHEVIKQGWKCGWFAGSRDPAAPLFLMLGPGCYDWDPAAMAWDRGGPGCSCVVGLGATPPPSRSSDFSRLYSPPPPLSSDNFGIDFSKNISKVSQILRFWFLKSHLAKIRGIRLLLSSTFTPVLKQYLEGYNLNRPRPTAKWIVS
jgi:hypothetical protein